MRSRNLPKLQSFIQEWVDEYYNSRKNKVTLLLDLNFNHDCVTKRPLFVMIQLIIYKCNFAVHVWDDESRWKEHGFKKIRSFNSVVLKQGDQDRILNGKL
jgi:hypothetical protein